MDSLKPDHIILGFFIANDIIPNAIAFEDSQGNYSTSDEMELKIKNELRNMLGTYYYSTIFRIVSIPVYIPKLRYQIAMNKDVMDRSYALLTEFNNLTESKGVKFSVVIFYPKDSIQGGIVEHWSNSREVGKSIYSFCKKNSIDALDILKYMNSSEHKNTYFYKADGHPNKEGNFLIAKAIYNDLVKPRMIPYQDKTASAAAEELKK
jgi:hypothetical protein